MPRKLQSVTISFGLVSIPVDLYTAVSPQSVSFHLIHKPCGSRIKEQRTCPTCQVVVNRDDLVRGFEIAKGQHVPIADEELSALEHEASESMEIAEFVPLGAVDPVYFEHTYYLGPRKGGEKPYELLSMAMAQAERAAIAKLVMRGKEHLVLIRAAEGGLILHLLYYADEIRKFSEIDKDQAKTTETELELAKRLIRELSAERFRPEHYRDEYRDRVLELVHRKTEGKTVTGQRPPRPAEVIDLLGALQASLEKATPRAKRRTEEPPLKRASGRR